VVGGVDVLGPYSLAAIVKRGEAGMRVSWCVYLHALARVSKEGATQRWMMQSQSVKGGCECNGTM
jgi:hypothetical protein